MMSTATAIVLIVIAAVLAAGITIALMIGVLLVGMSDAGRRAGKWGRNG